MSVHVSETRVVRGACPKIAPIPAPFWYHVEDGKLVEVTGDPDHPMTRGGCASSSRTLPSIITTPTASCTR